MKVSFLDLGIDLGTSNIIITSGGTAVLNEPTVIAYNLRTKTVAAFGKEAYSMLGRTPGHIAVIKPLRDGVITNNDMAQELIRRCILKVIGKRLINPRIIMCVPTKITEVERRAVVETAVQAGARTVYLLDEPVAALMGAGAEILKPFGHMVVDIGGGTTDVAVTSLGGIVASASVKCGGNLFDSSIVRYYSEYYKLLIGERSAEALKLEYANAFWPSAEEAGTVKGRSLINGMPASAPVSEADIYNAIGEDLSRIVETVLSVFESTPPELIGDIYEDGILIAGGGALIRGIDMYIYRETGVKCRIAQDPLGCVARGTSRAFHLRDQLRNGFERISVFSS